MKNRTVTLLTVLNLAILAFVTFSHIRSVQASDSAPVLRGKKLEIVDDQGRVRASIQIMPAGPARRADGSVVNDGKTYPEQVLFRLIRPDGRPSVKIATSEEGSDLDLGGGIDPTYIVINADGGDPSMTLTDKNGHRQVVKP